MSFETTSGSLNVGNIQPIMNPISQVSLDSTSMPGGESGLVRPLTPGLEMPQLPLSEDFPGIPQEENPVNLWG